MAESEPQDAEQRPSATGATALPNRVEEACDRVVDDGDDATEQLEELHGQPQPPVARWPRYVSVSIAVAASLVALLALREFASIIAPLFLAINLVITAYPLRVWLVRKRCPALLATLVMGLVVVAVLVGMIGGVVWSVTATIAKLTDYADQFSSLYHQSLNWLASFGFDQAALDNLFGQINPSSLAGPASQLVGSLSNAFGLGAVIVIALMFLTMDVQTIERRLQIANRARPRIALALQSFAEGVRRYWLVTTIFGLIVAVLDGIAVAILGVPLPVVWALLSFLTNYIPNVGFLIGLIPPAMIALVANDWQTSLIVIIAYVVLNFVVQSIIQPRFTGESVGVTTTVSFVSLLVWGSVMGALGTMLALPMTLLVKALLVDADPNSRWVNALIASSLDDAKSESAT